MREKTSPQFPTANPERSMAACDLNPSLSPIPTKTILLGEGVKYVRAFYPTLHLVRADRALQFDQRSHPPSARVVEHGADAGCGRHRAGGGWPNLQDDAMGFGAALG